MTDLTIELSQENGPVLFGHARGLALRERFDLDRREDLVDHVNVIIPMSIFTLSSSFFRGLFGRSVQKCGSVDRFEAKFRFDASDDLRLVLRGHTLLTIRLNWYSG